VNCFHPGLVATGFNRNNGLLMNLGMTIVKPVSRSPEKGAESLGPALGAALIWAFLPETKPAKYLD
jgi:hypothetical protein